MPVVLKKPKLNLDLFSISPIADESVNLKYCSLLNRHCSPLNRPDHRFPLNKQEPADVHDWLTRMIQEMDTTNPLLKQWDPSSSDRTIASWDLQWNVFLQLVLEKNFF